MSSILFNAHLLHWNIENGIRIVANEIQQKVKSQKHTIYQNHRILDELISIEENARRLIKLFQDEHGVFEQEVLSLEADTLHDSLEKFEERIKQIEYKHSIYPLKTIAQLEKQKVVSIRDRVMKQKHVSFTGEEKYGKYFDMHSLFHQYINLDEQFSKLEYTDFLQQFAKFDKIPISKKNFEYLQFLKDMLAYLEVFYKKTQPLNDITPKLKKLCDTFEAEWNSGGLKGWKEFLENHPSAHASKEANTSGKSKKRKRSRKRKRRHNYDELKEIAFLEAKVGLFSELLDDVTEATIEHIEKKQTKTWEEIQSDNIREKELEDEFVNESKNLVAKEKKYNNNLPIGWDGKPMPLWLYKLQKLNKEYICEICGNWSYWGPAAYEKHFFLWRHRHGLSCLGIHNASREFFLVHSIKEALKLKQDLEAKNETKPVEDIEQIEDAEGNIYNKSTFEMLKKQGIIS